MGLRTFSSGTDSGREEWTVWKTVPRVLLPLRRSTGEAGSSRGRHVSQVMKRFRKKGPRLSRRRGGLGTRLPSDSPRTGSTLRLAEDRLHSQPDDQRRLLRGEESWNVHVPLCRVRRVRQVVTTEDRWELHRQRRGHSVDRDSSDAPIRSPNFGVDGGRQWSSGLEESANDRRF